MSNERITVAQVEATFRALCEEAQRNGVDVTHWALVGQSGPTSWAIIGRLDNGGYYVLDNVPHQGNLGTTAREAQMRMWAMADGMRMVRFAREDAIIKARMDKTNG